MDKFKSIAIISVVTLFVFVTFIVSSNSKNNNPQEMNFDQIAIEQQGNLDLDGQATIDIVFNTTEGEIHAELYPDLVPETVKNFVELAKEDKYNGVLFHRVIKNFMVQTGDFENFNGTGGHSYKGEGTTIDEEFHPDLKHVYGALSMAKTAMPSTTGSQFFIVQNQQGTPHLDNGHSVFGMVKKGMDVVEKIASAKIGPMDNPLEDIKILDVKISK